MISQTEPEGAYNTGTVYEGGGKEPVKLGGL